MKKTDRQEMLVSLTVSCVELVIEGQPYTLVDIDIQTADGPQQPALTRPTIRLQTGEL